MDYDQVIMTLCRQLDDEQKEIFIATVRKAWEKDRAKMGEPKAPSNAADFPRRKRRGDMEKHTPASGTAHKRRSARLICRHRAAAQRTITGGVVSELVKAKRSAGGRLHPEKIPYSLPSPVLELCWKA